MPSQPSHVTSIVIVAISLMDGTMIKIADYIRGWEKSPFQDWPEAPWEVTTKAPELIADAISNLTDDYEIHDQVARHKSSIVEPHAVLKGPIILGPNSFVASGAYLRGGVFLDRNTIVGPACELKTTFMFNDSKVAHLSFVGDSIIGSNANIEAGAIIANYRNEMEDKEIKIVRNGVVIETGATKFGALVGDDVRIGANAVIAPGALLDVGFRLTRLGKVDQHPNPRL